MIVDALLSDSLAGLANNLDKLAIRLDEFVVALSSLLAHLVLADHDYTGRSLCCAGLAELRTALDVDVGHVVVFAENGNVRNDVHGRDVSGDDDDGGGVGQGGTGACGSGFAQRLDDFFYAAAEGLGFGGCGRTKLVAVTCIRVRALREFATRGA